MGEAETRQTKYTNVETHWIPKAGHATTRRRVLVRRSQPTPLAAVSLPTADYAPHHSTPFNCPPLRHSVRSHPLPSWPSTYSCVGFNPVHLQKPPPSNEKPYNSRNPRVLKFQVGPEVEVSREWIAQLQAQERLTKCSSCNAASYHPSHSVCTASSTDVRMRGVWMGPLCSLSVLMR